MTITVERIEAEVSANPDRAIRDLRRFDREIDKVAAKDRKVKIDVDSAAATRGAGQARDALGRFTRAAGDAGAAARGAAGGAQALGGALRGVGGGAGVGARGMARFGASLPMIAIALTAFASIIPYVISLVNTLGGAAFALGGQLSYLGGIAGALPGLFIAAAGGIAALAFGLKGIGPALKAYETAAKEAANSTRSQANLARQRENAERNLARALKGVTLAQKDLVEAEKDLAEARKDAQRDLEDSRQRVVDAVLAEEGAIDAVAEAQENLRKIQQKTIKSSHVLTKETDDFTGKVYEVARMNSAAADATDDRTDAERAVREAINSATKATRERKRAQEDLAVAERKGIDGSDRMVAALRRVETAQRGVETSIEGVRDAQDALRRTTEQASEAQRALKDALADLTPQGRAFVLFLKDEFIPAWGDVQKAFQTGLLGENGLTDGLRSIMGLFDTLKVRAEEFGATVGSALTAFMEGLGAREDQINRILESSNRVLDDLLKGFRQIGYALLNIVDGARPFTEWLAGKFSEKMQDFREKTDEWAKNGAFVRFFDQVREVSTKVWKIFGNIAGAIGNMITASEPLGTTILDKMVKITAEWKKWTGDAENRRKMKEWFSALKEPLNAVWDFLKKIVTEMLTIGEDGGPVMEDFAEVIRDIADAMPGIVQMMRDLSDIVGPVAKGVNALASAYEKIAGAIGTIMKWEDRANRFIFGDLAGKGGWGDGPGKGTTGSGGGGSWGGGSAAAPTTGKGSAGRMAKAAVSKFGGARITSGYRSPKLNAAVGGSPTSYHTDANNPAHDIVGKSGADMQRIYGYLFKNYGSSIREMIYGNWMVKRGKEMPYKRNDHWDHVHVAHKGGEVTRDWPTLPGLGANERPAILEVGERVVPARVSGAGVAGGMDPALFESILERVLAKAKPDVKMENTFTEHADPRLISAELAWRL